MDEIPSGKLLSEAILFQICWQATEQSGDFSEAFHTTVLPHTKAKVRFQDHTATGKLKAEITPTTPSGCHCSIM